MKPLPTRLGKYFRPAFVAYASALLLLVAAVVTGSKTLGGLALFAASTMLLFAAACGIGAIIIAARRRGTKPESYWFCLGNVLAAVLLLALGAVLAIASTTVLSGVRMLFASL